MINHNTRGIAFGLAVFFLRNDTIHRKKYLFDRNPMKMKMYIAFNKQLAILVESSTPKSAIFAFLQGVYSLYIDTTEIEYDCQRVFRNWTTLVISIQVSLSIADTQIK